MSSCNKYGACESRTLKNLKNINALKDKICMQYVVSQLKREMKKRRENYVR
jgi:hypothetical protein